MKRFMLPALVLLCLPLLLYAKDYKNVVIRTAEVGIVPFPHDPHLNKLGNNCTICHNSIYTIGKKNPVFTMADMEKGKSCGACHNKVRAFGLPECARCHPTIEAPIRIPDFGTIVFSHKFHLPLFTCSDCHPKLFRAQKGNPNVSMAEMEKGLSCGGCHDGKGAFSVKGSCTKCHTVKDIKYDADASFGHNYHLGLGYPCSSCHSQLFVAGENSKRYLMRDMEMGKSCGGCHNGKEAFSASGDCNRCHTGTPDVNFRAGAALFSHKIHIDVAKKMYICIDCHSGIFIGGVNSPRYTMGEMEKDRSCGACHDADIAFSVTGSCNLCHTSTKNVLYDLPTAGKVDFSHSFHIGIYKCDDCHNKLFTTGAQRKTYTMAQMEKGLSCGGCHDGKAAFSVATPKDCNRCHPVKEITFTADARFPHKRHLDLYSCNECHNTFFLAGPGNKRYTMAQMEKDRSCGACHDDFFAFSVKGACDRCHKSTIDVRYEVKETGPTIFSHKFHIGLYKCGECHYGIFRTGKEAIRYSMAQMEAGNSCGACHEGKAAFSVKGSCDKCHPVKELRFRDSGALFSHKFHTALYRCNDCHDKVYIPAEGNRRYSMNEMEKGLSCGVCHNGKDAFAVTGSCQKCHPLYKAIKYDFPNKKNVESVIFSHKVHMGRGYQCSDCHYKIVPTSVERKPATMSDMNRGKSCGACHGFQMAFSTKDDASCERCHKPGEYE